MDENYSIYFYVLHVLFKKKVVPVLSFSKDRNILFLGNYSTAKLKSKKVWLW